MICIYKLKLKWLLIKRWVSLHLYCLIMKWLHKCNLHYMPAISVGERTYHFWCKWCGMLDTRTKVVDETK